MTYISGPGPRPAVADEPAVVDPAPSPLRPALNTGAALLVIIGSVVAAVTEPVSESTTSLFGPAATLLSSDPRVFWMWWAIVAGLLVFIAWQWLPGGRGSGRLAAITWPAVVAGPAHLGWVLFAHAGLVIWTVVLLVVELIALCLLTWRLVKYQSSSKIESLATDIGWGLTLGFITFELLTAVGVVIEAYSLAEDEVYFIAAIVAYCVFIGGALGLAGRLYHQFAVGVALLWGFAWMGWERLMGEPRNYVLGALAGFGCFILLAAFYASGIRRRKNVQGLEQRPWG